MQDQYTRDKEPLTFQAAVLAQEFLQILCNAGKYREARKIFQELPDPVKALDRVQIIRGLIALKLELIAKLIRTRATLLRPA